ncbi:MAG TPA: beta-propeller domain-containing protein, partial [Haliangium sp.]|nr:beta-propeller domain-containing protein [Haliangium sp.]
TEMAEYVVSGWNNFFRPVLDQTRLIGIGINDENGRQLAVSLYDITQLANPEPMITRAEVSGEEGGWDWSEANWDHRAFTVLDNAVNVQAPTGETETGLVLLPFSSWDYGTGRSVSGVQIFTFSANTLTRRGLMEHGSPVRRTFAAGEGAAVNLSESDLTVFSQANLDEPAELGRLEVAPSYAKVLSFDGFRVRLKYASQYYWNYDPDVLPVVEIVPDALRVDVAQPMATFEVPHEAEVFKMGDDRLVVMTSRIIEYYPYESEVRLEVYDLSNPQNPVLAGEYAATDLPWPYDTTWRNRPLRTVHVLDDAIAFLAPNVQDQTVGWEQSCRTYVQDAPACAGAEPCSYAAGARTCRSIDGGAQFCEGGFARCTDEDDRTTCTPVTMQSIGNQLRNDCSSGVSMRSLMQFEVHVVDFTDPANPKRASTITFPAEYEGANMLAHGDTLYVSVKQPVTVLGDPRPHVRYFIIPVDLAAPSQPVFHPVINVPGELLAIRDDKIYTRDVAWGNAFIEYAVARLRIDDGIARLEKYYQLPYDHLGKLGIGDDGVVVLQHRNRWTASYWYYSTSGHRLTVLQPSELDTNAGYAVTFSDTMPYWMSLMAVRGSRAFLQVYSGVLTLDLRNPSEAQIESFLPSRSWQPTLEVDGDQAMLTGWYYGVDQYDLGDVSLHVQDRVEEAPAEPAAQ